MNVRVKATKSGVYSYSHGTLGLMLYELPLVLRVFPTAAAYDEEPEVSVTVSNLPFINSLA